MTARVLVVDDAPETSRDIGIKNPEREAVTQARRGGRILNPNALG
jgi:hypothetical protein